jgi:inner membrane protein
MENIISQFWHRNKIVLKSFWIGFLILLLLIPTALVNNLVTERKERQQQAVAEISSHWAGAQTITGPVIGIPYVVEARDDKGVLISQRQWAWLLPDKLTIDAKLNPEKRYRGIFQAVVYTTELRVNCRFDRLRLGDLGLTGADMLWKEATVFFDIGDPRGLQEDVSIRLDTQGVDPGHSAPATPTTRNQPLTANIDLSPAKISTDQFRSALTGSLPEWFNTAATGPLVFSATVKLKGTANLSFIPTAKETRVETVSAWPDPSFTGSSLPDLRQVKDSGFVADWLVLGSSHNFPQQWKGNNIDLAPSAFGVNLILPIDAYQQTTRCVKYAILIIVLTFTAFFLIEWVYQRSIHSLQYLLVGFALCLFYTLLLSFSEYLGFSQAYAIAAAATICLITWYVGSMLRSGRMSSFIFLLLSVQYGFVFTLIQLQDYALLMGSVGLFITLGTVMYFSRKIKWSGVPA